MIRKIVLSTCVLMCLLFSTSFLFAQVPGNNTIAGAIPITPVTTCGAITNQTLYQATSDAINSNCGSGTRRDVWYMFTTPSYVASVSITVSAPGTGLTNANTFIEAYNASAEAAVLSTNTLGCGGIGSTLSVSGLSQNTVYYFRVFTTATSTTTPATNWNFNVCVSYTAPAAPANNECSNAATLTIGSSGASTVWGATASSSIPAGCSAGISDDDVWFKFIATANNVNIDLSGIGSNLASAGAMLQLFSGSCASMSSLACGYKSLSTPSLNIGSTYFVRVYSSDATTSIGGISSGSVFSITVSNQSTPVTSNVSSGRMNEVFKQTILSTANVLADPWEVTYGPDGYLWITESKGYRVFRMHPVTGLKSTILDISMNSPFLPSAERTFNVQFDINARSFQGGLAGLALHPDWTTSKYVYVSYGHTYNSTSANSAGIFFTNRIVRFTYNTTTDRLESPVSICDTLPGSSDHNSQRLIIAPVGGTNYLFYAAGDMGAGQFGNAARPIKAQITSAYEGKILRFNLLSDGDADLDAWIPNDNPYNTSSPAKQNAVWCTGIRNNQGFAYGNGKLYGSSHGPYSDDEINILERDKNYGHPLVIGKADGNYNNARAGNNNGADATIMPLIVNEVANAAAISNYVDPIFSFYPAPAGSNSVPSSIQFILNNQNYVAPYNPTGAALGKNQHWLSEAPSGMDMYTHSAIPGWKNSLLLAALKWGRIMRLKLNTDGSAVTPTGGQDTVAYFDSQNRFRDLAISPDGKDFFVVMDKNTASSGPTENNPGVTACAGCVFKYSFLGYNDVSGKSAINSSVDISTPTQGTVVSGNVTTIDANNNSLWVPITGPDGNIIAEIKANTSVLGTITSSVYTQAGAPREDAWKRIYLNRSITINTQNPATSTVNIRFYITAAELASLVGASNSQGVGSGISSVGNLKVLKNNDASPGALTASTSTLIPGYTATHSGTTSGAGGHVLQVDVTGFSTFYFGDPTLRTLPLELLSFEGKLQNDMTVLQWETGNEQNTSHFDIERSIDGKRFEKIGMVKASGNNPGKLNYTYNDGDVKKQASDMIYYRLKMLDKDGSTVTSKIINVVLQPQSSVVLLYPNPITDVLNMRISLVKGDDLQIQVTDLQGRIVYFKNAVCAQGITSISIDTKAWSGQTYMVQVKGSDKKVLSSGKIVKAKR